ncbi:MAG: acyl-CoA synthetase [Myxococcota bacterium]|jgi:acyl-CoA synthetase (AMP-forming)/AMP-acid ligase II|nr:acyl-CoA synthetase [Myxococcota bacterium]
MEFNLADLFENAVDHFADREYIVADGKRHTYAEMEARANRLAHHLAAEGVGPGDHVGIYAYNSVEWVETLWAVFKIRAVWININFRYVEEELSYIFENADLRALVVAREFLPRVAAVRDALPDLQHVVEIDDGTPAHDASLLDRIDYEAAMAGASEARDFAPRSADDRYILYTGGTTGMPKGVVWRHEDVFFALGGGIDAQTGEAAKRPEDMVARGQAEAAPRVSLPIAPLMHGASQWAVMSGSFVGGKVVLVPKFEPDEAWRLVVAEKVNVLMITGDAMGRPMVEALRDGEASKEKLDLSSLFLVVSTAAIFSPTVKDDFFDFFPNLLIIDSIGASESGANGMALITRGNTAMLGGGPTVKAGHGTTVLDGNLEPLEPGSGVRGKVARSGYIPLEYYKDPVKSAETFVTTEDGTRYSIPGDWAQLEADGTITLLGRGSVSINSGGEKIYPEEVEAAVKDHPDAYDAVVVGVPDERFGSRVAAVVEPREGATPTLESIQEHCRTKIAGYKIPRQIHLVGRIERSPSGKPDYPWARRVALGEQEA